VNQVSGVEDVLGEVIAPILSLADGTDIENRQERQGTQKKRMLA
jgi:hypothetical protein